MLRSDDIELDTISSDEVSLQEPSSNRSITKQLRWAHLVFVYKIYITSFLLVVVVAVQWFLITMIKLVQKFVTSYNYVFLAVIFIHFLLLTVIQYVLRPKDQKFKFVVFIYIFMLMEIGSVIISRPMAESKKSSLLYASIITLIIYIIDLILASNSHMKMERKPENLALWSLTCFVTTAIILIIALEISLVNLKISIVSILIFFLTIFFVVWGRALGSIKLYNNENSYTYYYIVLHYFNILSLFANALVFFETI